MFKTVKDLQDFIIWAKQEKIAVLKVDNVEIHMSPYAFIDGLSSQTPVKTETAKQDVELELDPPLSKEEEDEILFHSAR